jgi:hypothetical protein
MKRFLLFSAFSLATIGFLSGIHIAVASDPVSTPIAPSQLVTALHPVVVHFPRMPISGYNFTYTYNVNRSTTHSQPEIGALRSLINGPTSSEVSGLNLQAIVPATLGTCAGQPVPADAVNAGKFMYKRQIAGTNVAYKIRFCQSTNSGGIGDDARLRSAISETLWANIGYVSGANNISQIDISYANGECITNGGNSPCWP